MLSEPENRDNFTRLHDYPADDDDAATPPLPPVSPCENPRHHSPPDSPTDTERTGFWPGEETGFVGATPGGGGRGDLDDQPARASSSDEGFCGNSGTSDASSEEFLARQQVLLMYSDMQMQLLKALGSGGGSVYRQPGHGGGATTAVEREKRADVITKTENPKIPMSVMQMGVVDGERGGFADGGRVSSSYPGHNNNRNVTERYACFMAWEPGKRRKNHFGFVYFPPPPL